MTLLVPNDDHAAQVSEKFVMLVVGSTVDDNKFQCTVFFVVDVRDLRREQDGITGIQQAVWRNDCSPCSTLPSSIPASFIHAILTPDSSSAVNRKVGGAGRSG